MQIDGYEYTHKRWMWFCPIYLDLASDEVTITTSSRWYAPLFWTAMGLEQLRIAATSLVLPDWEPTFMFKVTEEL